MTEGELLDHTPINKGKKHRDRTPSVIAELDPEWLVWAYEHWDPKPCSKALYDDCVKDVAEQRRQGRVARDQDVES
jgi:hypothetical protein